MMQATKKELLEKRNNPNALNAVIRPTENYHGRAALETFMRLARS